MCTSINKGMSTVGPTRIPLLASTQVSKPRRHRRDRPPPNQGSPQKKPSHAVLETPANTQPPARGSPTDIEVRRQAEILENMYRGLSVQELGTRVKKRLDYRESAEEKVQRQKRELAAQRKQIEVAKREAEELLRFTERLAAADNVADTIARGGASLAHRHRHTRHVDRAGKSLVFAAPKSTPPDTTRPRSEFQPTPVPVSRPEPRVDSDEPDVEDAPDAPRLQGAPQQPRPRSFATQTTEPETKPVPVPEPEPQPQPVPRQANSDTQTLLANFSPATIQSTQTQVRATTAANPQTAAAAATAQSTQSSATQGMNAVASAARAAQGASPEALVSLLEELQRNKQLQQLVASGLLSWNDLLSDKRETLPDGTKARVVDSKKLLALQQRLSTLAQKEAGKLQNIQEVAVRKRTVPGLKATTATAMYPGVSVFMYPREMPAGRPGA
jgi:hypothetical protein